MIYAYPDYYEKFRCSAGSCRHSCCIGWEIDIDEKSLARYDDTEGALGAELRESISREGDACFILREGERCPFLNGENLCRLIIEKGEDFLCDICRDHPRFRSFLPGRTEIGLGLCCEEAARLIITQEEPVCLTESGKDEHDGETDSIINGRSELLKIVQNRSMDLSSRIELLLSFYDISLPEKTPAQWAEFFLSLERLEEEWTVQLEKLGTFEKFALPRGTEFEQLLVYFLYRHFPECYDDCDAHSKILFSVLSVQLLCTLYDGSRESLIELARLYSAEIEYSDENLELIYDELMK